MKNIIQMLALIGAICTPTSIILWIFAYELGIYKETSVYLLFISLACGFLSIVLDTISDYVYGED